VFYARVLQQLTFVTAEEERILEARGPALRRKAAPWCTKRFVETWKASTFVKVDSERLQHSFVKKQCLIRIRILNADRMLETILSSAGPYGVGWVAEHVYGYDLHAQVSQQGKGRFCASLRNELAREHVTRVIG
jgi:hypothetical protein